MTNYNDGKWHGWNGGECPVHPNSRVRVAYIDGLLGEITEDTTQARHFKWDSESEPIVAFVVVQEYTEPREFWIAQTNNWIDIKLSKPSDPYGYFKVREVLDDH